MDQIIIINNKVEFEKTLDIIFEAVDIEGFHVHVIDISHFCSSELSWVQENKHPSVKIIKVNNNLKLDINALRIVLKDKLYTFCPSCGCETYE